MQSSRTYGNSSSTQPQVRSRGNPGKQLWISRRIQDSGQPGDWISGDRRGKGDLGQPRDSNRRRSRRPKLWGNPEQRSRQTRKVRSEETRRSTSRGRKMGMRGNPETHRRRYRRIGEPGQPGETIHRHRRRMRNSRQLEDPSPAKPEDAGNGATRDLIDRRDQKAKNRGNPRFHDW